MACAEAGLAAQAMVSVAVAAPSALSCDGLTLQLIWLEEGVHVKVTSPLKLFREARFNPRFPVLPELSVISGSCGASEKSPAFCVAVRLTALPIEERSWLSPR